MVEDPSYGRAKELFLEAVRRPEGQRRAFLDSACGADATLRREVEELLGFNDAARVPADWPAAPWALGPEKDAPLPERLGGYRILGILGSGGMGIVYRAVRDDPPEEVALKVLRPGLLSQALRSRFRREAEALRRLDHPAIARFLEAGTFDTNAGPQPYFSMEYIDGRSLRDYVHDANPTENQRLQVLVTICAAVHYAHERGVVHRDLKPDNILVDRDGGPRILDFGIAHVADLDIRITTFFTSAGELVGTLQYMSPEQAMGAPEAVDARSDVYSLGVLAYELLSGRLPYDTPSQSLARRLAALLTTEPVPLGDVYAPARGSLEAIVMKALARAPGARYATAAEMADDIRRHLERRPVAALSSHLRARARRFARRHSRGVVLAGVALAGAMVAGTAFLLGTRGRPAAGLESGAALERAQGLLVEAEQVLHVGMPNREAIEACIPTLLTARGLLGAAPGDTLAAVLRRHANHRLGEAHYWLGCMDHDTRRLKDAVGYYELASMILTLPGLDPDNPVHRVIRAHKAAHGAAGMALAYLAISRYELPKQYLREAIWYCEHAFDILANELGGGSGALAIPAADTHYGAMLNQLGQTLVAEAVVRDSLDLVDRALACFAHADSATELHRSWVPYASLLHESGVGYMVRAEPTGSRADLDSAAVRLRAAARLRRAGRRDIPLADTERALARLACVEGRWTRDAAARERLLQEARDHLDEASDALGGAVHPVDRAFLDLDRARVEVERAVLLANGRGLVTADSFLTLASATLATKRYPVPWAETEYVRGRLLRARWAIEGSQEERRQAQRALRRGRELLPAEEHPRLRRLFDAELQLLAKPVVERR